MSRLPTTRQSPAPLHRRIMRRVQGSVLRDRELIVRSGGRVTYVPLPRTSQAAALLVFGAFGLWTLHTTYAYFSHDQALVAREAEIALREQALAGLKADLAQARRRVADVTDALEKNEKGVVGLIGQNQTLTNNLRSLREEMARLDGERGRVEKEKAALAEKLKATEKHLAQSEERSRALAGDLKATDTKLALALNDKSRANERGQSLSGRVSELQDRLSSLKESQSTLLDRIAETSQSEIRRLRGILASTGVRIDRLLEAQGVTTTGTGGPFEAAPRDGTVASLEEGVEAALGNASGMIDQLEGLQRIVRSLPLAAPLDYYHITSAYGVRTDPINGESAIHRGLDFGAKVRAPVLATAKGTVTYAGWKGKFGRFVEIDHGNGVVTRYGHLRRISVSRGDKIEFRAQIGQMGNSGRSTGTHLHYEIHVNGASVDPQKFLKAGKNVFKG